MTYEWDPILAPWADAHPEVGQPEGAGIRLPPDFLVLCQISPGYVLVFPGAAPVVMVKRPRVDNAAMGQAAKTPR